MYKSNKKYIEDTLWIISSIVKNILTSSRNLKINSSPLVSIGFMMKYAMIDMMKKTEVSEAKIALPSSIRKLDFTSSTVFSLFLSKHQMSHTVPSCKNEKNDTTKPYMMKLM